MPIHIEDLRSSLAMLHKTEGSMARVGIGFEVVRASRRAGRMMRRTTQAGVLKNASIHAEPARVSFASADISRRSAQFRELYSAFTRDKMAFGGLVVRTRWMGWRWAGSSKEANRKEANVCHAQFARLDTGLPSAVGAKGANVIAISGPLP